MMSGLAPPPLPPENIGVPFHGPPPAPLPTPTPISSSTLHAEFFLSFGAPLHPELDEAIATGDAAQVSAEFARARKHYPQTNVTFNTALQCAIKYGRPEIVSHLLSSGVPATECDLLAAAAMGSIPIVACLVEHLAWSLNTVASNGHTVLSRAVPHEHLVVWLLSKGADLNLQDAWSETPLSRAVESGSLEVVTRLLDAGADISRGAPLHMSLRRKEDSASLELMEKLLVLGAPVDRYQGEDSLAWQEVGFPRGTALHSASSRGNVLAVQLLLAHGADPLRNKKVGTSEIPDSSPYEEARFRGHAEVMSVLQRHICWGESFHRYRL
ncbi:hypothetical protein LTR48_002924 [Friedmanniomyces endolithicus]|uniref:Uncharacterized protein n=1 Tax=Rachicladosporium monterosium TaxID=1507873 RepID=A0ABR0L9N5_9PEZI|nr:hypothetical protein LTR29_014247 [Friedmanniomyces endolithicus]KAK1087089.1 hypothetical protein LTR48_002924 [Friedmanniomyces endolithicus]KAK1820253.1 hypothetical protein LTR12_005259 [Friedmanniomyces endolithicus]KAK5145634.1 hypothetical protein LTR32_002637 [Rachicladosporium monterosium]